MVCYHPSDSFKSSNLTERDKITTQKVYIYKMYLNENRTLGIAALEFQMVLALHWNLEMDNDKLINEQFTYIEPTDMILVLIHPV